MDVVICVSSKDCLIVKKTVFYIHRNIESDNIYLITDKHSFGFFSKRFRSRYNISLIDEEEIVADRRQLEAIAGRHFTCEYRFGGITSSSSRWNLRVADTPKIII